MQRLWFWVIRLLLRPVLSARVPVCLQRIWGRLLALPLRGPAGITYRTDTMASVPVLTACPNQCASARGVLYLHGGGYVMGGFGSHGKLAAAVGKAAAARVWLPAYRLAPEHPYPAALQDALTVYTTILEKGQDPALFTIAGDSAGGGLTLALALALRDAGLPLPGALVLMSPWTDTHLCGETITSHAHRDPMVSPSWLRWAAKAYRGQQPNDETSLLYADLSGLPPILIQVGSEEVLLSDAQRLYQQAQASGLDCEFKQFDGLWHVFQLQYSWLKASTAAIEEIGRFITKQTPLRTDHRQ